MRLLSKFSRWRPILRALPVSLGVSVVLAAPLGAAAAPPPAPLTYPVDAVKAVFLYRFAGYVRWPQPAASSPRFTIAVIGADEVAAQLRQLLPDHPIQGKPAKVESIDSIRELGDAQMLYVGAGYRGNLRTLIDALQDRPVLVVTDEPGALDAGSTVNFLLLDQHVRFEISTAAAGRAGLNISAALLAVAKRIRTGNLLLNAACFWAVVRDGRDTACLALMARR